MKSGEDRNGCTRLPLRAPAADGLVSTRARLERVVDQQLRTPERAEAGETWTKAGDESDVPTAVREGYFWLLAGIVEAIDYSAQAERCLAEADCWLAPLTVRQLQRLLSVATAAATESWATIREAAGSR
jgi:hypothetical protein